MASEEEELAELFNGFSAKFDQLCQARHEAGAAEYGVLTFLGNDVIRMMAEELADTSNYCRMQFMKLMYLQAVLEEELKDKTVPSTIGTESFKGAKDVGWDG